MFARPSRIRTSVLLAISWAAIRRAEFLSHHRIGVPILETAMTPGRHQLMKLNWPHYLPDCLAAVIAMNWNLTSMRWLWQSCCSTGSTIWERR